MREITATEVWELKGCLQELAFCHNEVSTDFKGNYPSSSYVNTLKSFENALLEKSSRIAVTEENGQIIGFCKIDVRRDNGKLDYLVVHKDYRERGYGIVLMDWPMKCFDEDCVRYVEVKVVDGNDAIHLYEKYGFKINAHILVKD